MGIVHFAGLGKAPGAVTSGLSYLKNELKLNPEFGKIVESLVIFTSCEIIEGKEKASSCEDNEYMTRNTKKKWVKKFDNSLDIVKEFLLREFEGTSLYVCKVNVNDFSKCFETVAKALLKFHPTGHVGKHVWANITGGTNVLNAAIMQVAYLSGYIPVLYYTFVAKREDNKYLKPFSRKEEEFRFRKIFVVKTIFDDKFRLILEELEKVGKWISSKDLLSRLKGSHYNSFGEMEVNFFKKDYLNIMDGWCIERKEKQDLDRISKDGKDLLKIIRSPLFTTLTSHKYPINFKELIKDLCIKKIL